MYEIVVHFKYHDDVVDIQESLESAQLAVMRYQHQGYKAFYRMKTR